MKPRIYVRKVQPSRKGFGSHMTLWIWMGTNPVGQDWSLGCVRLFTLEEAMQHYGRKLARAARRSA